MSNLEFQSVPLHELYLNPTFPMYAKNSPVVFLVAPRKGSDDALAPQDVIAVSLDPEKLVLLYGVKNVNQSYTEIKFRDHTQELDNTSRIFNPFTRIITYYNNLKSIIEVLTDNKAMWHSLGLQHLDYFIQSSYLPDLKIKTELDVDNQQIKIWFPDEPITIIRVDEFNQAYA